MCRPGASDSAWDTPGGPDRRRIRPCYGNHLSPQTHLKMKVNWTLFFATLMGILSTCVGGDCNITHVLHCYDSLTHYEGLSFPFYGTDHLDLIETCRTMNDSFSCVEVYVDYCKGRADCDEECQQAIEDIEIFSNNTGLRHAQKELCNPKSSLRQAYLENYECLEKNEKKYATCHSISLRSQEYMVKIEDPMDAVNARCCFFTWLHDCFANATRETCNENATLFISFTMHTLLSQMSIPLCGPNPDICEHPPLPLTDEEDPLLDEHDISDVDNSIEREHRKWDDAHEEAEASSNKKHTSHGSIHTYSMWTITMSFMVLLSRFML